MGIDAVAVLRIWKLAAPRDAFGAERLVQHRGDASLVHTFARFDGAAPDEHALGLRGLLGDALDAHDDPRGILFFPDAGEPRQRSYDGIVAEIGGGGVWAPLVGKDHVPRRYAAAAKTTHEALVAKMIATMGRDAALAFDMMARVHLFDILSTGGRPDSIEGYRASRGELTAKLGPAFAASYDERARKKVEVEVAAQAAFFERLTGKKD